MLVDGPIRSDLICLDRYRSEKTPAVASLIAKYGSKGWTIKKADETGINAFEMWCYRKILRKLYTEHKTNVWCLQKIGTNLQSPKQTAKGKLKYFGHIK